MRCIVTEFNFTIFKIYTLNRKLFAWINFESLTWKNSTPFNSRIYLFSTLHPLEICRNISETARCL